MKISTDNVNNVNKNIIKIKSKLGNRFSYVFRKYYYETTKLS